MRSRRDIDIVGAAASGERNEWQDAIIMSWGVQSGTTADNARGLNGKMLSFVCPSEI
jgi:hypothetical protein